MPRKLFDFVIGNPPYNADFEDSGDNGNFAKPVYNDFMDAAYKVAEKVELIHPARFLFDAGSTPKAWNQKILKDEHFKVLDYKANSSSVFPNTDIKGGIAISYRSSKDTFGAIEHFIVFDELRSIANKINKIPHKSINTIMYSPEAYKFTEIMHIEHPDVAELLSKGHRYDLKTSVFSNLEKLIFFDEPHSDGDYIQILGLKNGNRIKKWINKKYITGPDNFEKYKVFIPKANGSGAIGEVLSTPLIGSPLIGHTQTFLSVGCFANLQDAENLLKYIKTKFARVLLGILKITQDNTAGKWKFVPLQDFTSSSDIDWSQSVSGIDQQLYKKYGFSDSEVSFIEANVKEMA